MKPLTQGLVAMLAVCLILLWDAHWKEDQAKSTIYRILFWLDRSSLDELVRTFDYDKQSLAYKSVKWEQDFKEDKE